MPQMNPETAELLKEKIESLLTEFINQGDIKYSVSIAENRVIVTIKENGHRTANRPLIVDFGNGEVIRTSSKKSAAQVLVDVINKADPAKVQQENIILLHNRSALGRSMIKGSKHTRLDYAVPQAALEFISTMEYLAESNTETFEGGDDNDITW